MVTLIRSSYLIASGSISIPAAGAVYFSIPVFVALKLSIIPPYKATIDNPYLLL
jgi:hypothetical protein